MYWTARVHRPYTTAPDAEAVIGAGDGTRENPYQNLQTALYNVKPGGTIIVLGSEVKSVAPAIHPYAGDLRENILELDRPVSIKAESAEGVAYAGQIKFQKFPGQVQASWTGTKNADGSWDTFGTNNTISGVVEFDGINFTHTGGDVISNYDANAVLEGCELVITDCEFSNMQAGSAIRISSHMKSVTITDTDFTVTRKPEDGYQKAYLVWTDSTKALDISGCTFDGNGAYRAAVHVGNGHLDGEEASITGCTFKGFERCNPARADQRSEDTTTIADNTFENHPAL